MQDTARPQRIVSTTSTTLPILRPVILILYRALYKVVCVSIKIFYSFDFGIERGYIFSLPPVIELQYIVSLTFWLQY